MLVAVTNAASFGVEYKNALGAATWTPLGTYTATGTVTAVADTNAVPVRFYRAVAP